MGDNPLEPKIETPKVVDVVAAAAGVPTPGHVKTVWSLVRKHRKLALLLGGLGVTAAAGGYGYKYLSPTPGKANAQPEAPAIAAKPEQPATYTPDGEDRMPAVIPVKAETPAPDVPKVPNITLPPLRPAAPSTNKSDTAEPPLLLPSMGEPTKEAGPTIPPTLPEVKAPADIKAPDIAAPTLPTGPTISAPREDKKKADAKKKAAGDDIFKAPDLPAFDPKKVDPDAKPAALPSTVNEKKDKKDSAPVIRVQGVQPASVPDVPKVDAPSAVKKDEPKKDGALDLPPIPPLEIPPPPGGQKTDAPIIPPPPPVGSEKKDHPKDHTIPSIDVPTIGGDPKIDPPTKPLGPMPMDVKPPDIKPVVPTINPVTIPPIDTRNDVPPPAPEKKTTYEEDWHTWKTGDTYSLISQEYYHDGKFSAALEAYNKEHRKPGDPIVRVPELWKLQDLYPNLIGKTPDKPERIAPPEAKPANNSGIRFEPVAPLSGAGRSAPAATTSRTDEYKVTADAGETIREVARKALGNPDSWRKLSSLNPDLDPTLPIPAGTVLKLPK